MEKYGFVYIWYDRKRKMYYIGSHWGKEADGYLCSSRRMRDAYRRRKEDFKRRILKTKIFTKSEMIDEEYKWLSLVSKEELGKKYYNLSNHRQTHWSSGKNILTIGEKISKANKGKKAWNKGKTGISEETKLKLSEGTKKGMKNWWDGLTGEELEKAKQKKREANYKKSYYKTDEFRQKMSMIAKNRSTNFGRKAA